MRIQIKNPVGKTFDIDIGADEAPTALTIKKLIYKQEGIEIADQELVVEGQKWQNHQTYLIFSAKNAEVPPRINQLQTLLLRIRPMPEPLRILVGMNYELLSTQHPAIAREIIKDTRTKRYELKDFMDIGPYWDSLSEYERVKILTLPKNASNLDAAMQETAILSQLGMGKS